MPRSARPTSARVREALFSIVGHDLAGVAVLDAFGGTGLLGLEAWSRGAVVTIVERDRKAYRRILENAEALRADVQILQGDIRELANTFSTFELVLADPPYALEPTPILVALAPLVADRLILETDSRTSMPSTAGDLTLAKTRSYGGTSLSVFSRG